MITKDLTFVIMQLRAAKADEIKDKDFKSDWNSKFSWFTQKRCGSITTIHGEKHSNSVKFAELFLSVTSLA